MVWDAIAPIMTSLLWTYPLFHWGLWTSVNVSDLIKIVHVRGILYTYISYESLSWLVCYVNDIYEYDQINKLFILFLSFEFALNNNITGMYVCVLPSSELC